MTLSKVNCLISTEVGVLHVAVILMSCISIAYIWIC